MNATIHQAFGSPEKNWIEDSLEDNGNYLCKCSTCEEQFVGHKRRIYCKTCRPKWNLFLDDIRQPEEAYAYTGFEKFATLDWFVVKDYEEFIRAVAVRGMPEFISFDHDLADEHYTPPEYWTDYDSSKEYQESRQYQEKTGLDCAKWLVEWCLQWGYKLPDFYVHSMNPVGKDNIIAYLNQYKKHEQNV